MPNPILKASRLLAFALICLAAAGCETMQPLTPSPDFVDDTVIVSDFAQFFRLGPQQAGGADLSLRTGERVMLQRKEFGYSRVQLEDGQVGYMANEDLQPAPPEPRRKFGLREKPDSRGDDSAPRRKQRGPASEEDFTDADIPLPDPNLDIMPEEIPLEPLPEVPPPPPLEPANQPIREPVKVPLPGPEPDAAPVGPPSITPPQEAPAPPVSTST
jgi:hypothetical protein